MLRLPCATDQSSRQFRKKGRLLMLLNFWRSSSTSSNRCQRVDHPADEQQEVYASENVCTRTLSDFMLTKAGTRRPACPSPLLLLSGRARERAQGTGKQARQRDDLAAGIARERKAHYSFASGHLAEFEQPRADRL